MRRAWLVGALFAVMLAACSAPSGSGASRSLQVVAGQNFWGSIAAQLGGSHVSVSSVVTNPNADPHDYETSNVDARAFATADYVILNGAGYDDWGSKLLAGNPNDARKVLIVADLLKKKAGDNPHFWYNPEWVEQVADRMTADYKALDPADATYFDEQRMALRQSMQPYHQRIASIRDAFHGTPVGATESIFVYLAQALGLNLTSPPAFMQAVAEGNDPPASTVAAFQNQINGKEVKVLVFNVQTASNVTEGLKKLAADNGIPLVGISETLQPAGATFQDWQAAQLLRLQNALSARALTG
ncbi:MAG TPA: zinc ABC transporter substrate-binding protein [Candidatus Dormibacteraeota bacterium]